MWMDEAYAEMVWRLPRSNQGRNGKQHHLDTTRYKVASNQDSSNTTSNPQAVHTKRIHHAPDADRGTRNSVRQDIANRLAYV